MKIKIYKFYKAAVEIVATCRFRIENVDRITSLKLKNRLTVITFSKIGHSTFGVSKLESSIDNYKIKWIVEFDFVTIIVS